MPEYHLAEAEKKFAQLIWKHEPLPSRRLCDRGLFQNEKSQVTSLVSREEFHRQQSRSFVQEAFGGSLPGFLTAFMGGRKLTQAQAEELRDLIDHYEEE